MWSRDLIDCESGRWVCQVFGNGGGVTFSQYFYRTGGGGGRELRVALIGTSMQHAWRWQSKWGHDTIWQSPDCHMHLIVWQNTHNTKRRSTYTSVKLTALHIIKIKDCSKWLKVLAHQTSSLSGSFRWKWREGVECLSQSGATRFVETCFTENKWLDAVRLLRMAKRSYSCCLCQHLMGLRVLIRKGKSECHDLDTQTSEQSINQCSSQNAQMGL